MFTGWLCDKPCVFSEDYFMQVRRLFPHCTQTKGVLNTFKFEGGRCMTRGIV
jgi:hypothetical protein